MAVLPPFAMQAPCTNYIANFHLKKEQTTTLIPASKDIHKCTKQINLNFKIFLLKIEKIHKFGINYHKYMIKQLFLSILRCFLLKIPTVKNFASGNVSSRPYRGSISSIYAKSVYDLTVAIINKCFEFKMSVLK